MVSERVEMRIGTLPLGRPHEHDVAQVGRHVDGSLIPITDAGRGHHHRTIHECTCPHRRVFCLAALLISRSGLHLVGTEVEMLGKGHHDLHHIVLFPSAGRNLHIAAGLAFLGNDLPVELHRETLRSPIGHAQLHGELSLPLGDAEGRLLGRPLAFLSDGDSLLLPMGGGGHIERHPDGVVIDEVGGLLIFHMVLHTRSTAACGLWRLVAPRLRGIETDGILIDGLVPARIHRPDNLVVEHPLIIVHVAGVVGIEPIQLLRQFGQIVGTTRFVERGFGMQFTPSPTRHVRTHRRDLRIGLTEHLAVAHTSHRITVSALNHRPEVLRQIIIVGIAVGAERAQSSRHHRDVLVGMTRTDGVHILRQRVEERRTVETIGGFYQMRLLFGCSRQL